MTSSTPTLRDVAAEAGVSPMTASNALRGKPGVKESTRAKVIAAAKKLNYRINLTASMLKSGRSNIIPSSSTNSIRRSIQSSRRR